MNDVSELFSEFLWYPDLAFSHKSMQWHIKIRHFFCIQWPQPFRLLPDSLSQYHMQTLWIWYCSLNSYSITLILILAHWFLNYNRIFANWIHFPEWFLFLIFLYISHYFSSIFHIMFCIIFYNHKKWKMKLQDIGISRISCSEHKQNIIPEYLHINFIPKYQNSFFFINRTLSQKEPRYPITVINATITNSIPQLTPFNHSLITSSENPIVFTRV